MLKAPGKPGRRPKKRGHIAPELLAFVGKPPATKPSGQKVFGYAGKRCEHGNQHTKTGRLSK